MYELKIKTQIVNDIKTGMSYGVIGKKYGIPKSSVQHIVEKYGHISTVLFINIYIYIYIYVIH